MNKAVRLLRDVPVDSVVEVEWLDACGRGGWRPRPEAVEWATGVDGTLHRTVGFLLAVTKTSVAVAQSTVRYDEFVDNVDALLTIPLSAIVRTRVLRRAK